MAYDQRKSSFPYGEQAGQRGEAAKDMEVLPKSDTVDLERYPYAFLVTTDGTVSVIPEEHRNDTPVSLGTVSAGTVVSCGIRRVMSTGTSATLVGFFAEGLTGAL